MSKKSKSSKKTKKAFAAKFKLMPHLVATLLITLLALSIFANTFGNEFVYDDVITIVEDEGIRDWQNLVSSVPSWYKRLLREVTYTIDYHFWQLNPFGYHLTNLILHILNANLLYFLIYRMFANKRLALITGLVFAAHPVHVDAVAAIAHRKDLLAMLFYILGFLCYLKKTQSRWFLLGAGVSYLLAISGKEAAAIALPIVCLLYEFTFAKDKLALIRKNLKHYLIGVIVVGLVIGFVIIKLGIFEWAFGPKNISEVSLGRTESYLCLLLTVSKCLWQYAALLLVPFNLSLDHYIPISKSFFEIEVLGSIGLLVSLFIFTPKIYRYSKGIFFGMSWFLINWLPISNIIPLTQHFVAERYLYVPSVGFCLILAIFIDRIYQSKPRRAISISVAILCLYSSLTIRRNFDWKSNYTLSLKTIQQNPNSVIAHYNSGKYYFQKGEKDKALEALNKAIKIYPDYYQAHYLLGSLYHQSGEDGQAIKYLNRISGDVDAYNLLGVIYEKGEEFEKAIVQFKKVLEIDPEFKKAYNNLAVVYEKMGKEEEAVKTYKKAIKIDPEYAKPYENLARIYASRQGAYLDEALRFSRKAVLLNPTHFNFYVSGCIYYKKGWYWQAEAELKRALQLAPDNRLYLKTLQVIGQRISR